MTAKSATVTERGGGDKAQQTQTQTETQTQTDDKHDFFWTYTEEPHRTRRLAIIKAHPEVRFARTEKQNETAWRTKEN